MSKKNQMMVQEKNITDNVLNRINTMKDEGAYKYQITIVQKMLLKSAPFKIARRLRQEIINQYYKLAPRKICQTITEMVVQGLNPMKNKAISDTLRLN